MSKHRHKKKINAIKGVGKGKIKVLWRTFKDVILEYYRNGVNKYEIANRIGLPVEMLVTISDIHKTEVNAAKAFYVQNTVFRNIKNENEKKPSKQTPPHEATETAMPKLSDIYPVIPPVIPVEKEEVETIPEIPTVMLDDIKFVTTIGTHNRKISDETAKSILKDLKENVMTQGELAKLYGVSRSTISAIKCGRGRFKLVDVIEKKVKEPEVIDPSKEVDTQTRLTKKQKRQQEIQAEAAANIVKLDDLMILPVISTKEEEGKERAEETIQEMEQLMLSTAFIDKRTPVTHYAICGMIANRHDMPVDTYLFQSISGELSSNYAVQYDVAVQRLKDVTGMKEDGSRAYNGIYLYVTGLPSIMATIIKACSDLKLGLILMQYRPDRHYHHQIIFTVDENPCPPELERVYHCPLYTYGCLTQDFINIRKGYEVIEFVAGSDQEKEVTLFCDKDKAWEFYTAMCQACPTSSIILNNIYMTANNWVYVGRTLRRIVNTTHGYTY